MKKIYTCLSIFLVLLAFNTAKAQVVVVEDFEDGAATTDFPGWTSPTFPGFNPNMDNPCEGAQSLRTELHAGNVGDDLQFLSSVATGFDIDVSFEVKIVDLAGTLVSGNFGSVELYYTIDNGATWVLHDTIDQADLPLDCTIFSTTVPAASVPAGSDFGWKFEAIWNTGDYYVYVDDFKAVEQVSCIEPVNVEIDEASITFDSATVTWDDLNNPVAGDYEIAFCESPGDPGDGTIGNGNPTCLSGSWDLVSIAAEPFTFTETGLTDGTTYYVYVRTICGPNDKSVWSLADIFQTVAIGTDCSVPIDVPNPLPYVHSSSTDVYGAEEYSGIAGANCGSGANLLDGYEVVYKYTPSINDILTIDVTGLTANDVGVFVYEDCNDIGDFCIGGAATTTGTDLNVNSLFVTAGEDYYIVIASIDPVAGGTPLNTDYTLTINGFDCTTWVPPTLPPTGTPISYVAPPQTLADFSMTLSGVNPTIEGADLVWYQDNAGTQGTEITSPLDGVALTDQGCFWVAQSIGTCVGPAIQVCFDEFNCSTDLGGITSTTGDSVCDSGVMTLTATAADPSHIYWYDSPTGGNLVEVGGTYTTENLSTTTTYYATEVFLGSGEIPNQGIIGPLTQAISSNDNYGLAIDVQQPFTLIDLQVYVAGSGDITLKLEGPNNYEKFGSFSVTPGTPTSPTLNTIDLDWDLDEPGTYYLRKASGPAMMIVQSSDTSFPYSLGSAGSITSGASDTGTTGDYYYFFNWTITGPEALCEASPRTPVDATVYTTKSTTVTADDMIVCIGGNTMLHATSIDPDYVYTWTWFDPQANPPGQQTATGPDITVTVNQNTTFTVTAVNPNTTCQYVNTISLEVKGAADLALTPDQEICIGETVQLTAGGKVYNFESANPGWTTVNTSTVVDPNASVASADWQLVNSPHQASGGIFSNDDSQFYISMANLLGPGGTLHTELISPPISLVGVGSASVSFYHYIRWNQNQTTTSRVQVSDDGGLSWSDLKTYNSTVGGTDQDPFVGFVQETLDLTPFVGSTVQIRFLFEGGWGWYWAVDNVVFSRSFLSGSVSWTPMTDLYFDDQATVPYNGTPTNVVYYMPSQGGTYTYSADLNIVNCSSATADVVITVYDTPVPTGPATQTFLAGDILDDLTVTGQNLSYYIEDANGDLDQISFNTPLVDGTVYYVTQTLNGCESEPISITVDQECPEPLNVEATPAADGDGTTAQVIVTWDPPASIAGVLDYRLLITDITSGGSTVVYDAMVPLTQGFEIVDDLPLDHDFTAEVFSVCDPNVPVYGAAIVVNFNTDNLLGVGDMQFDGLTYYPNPTRGMVYFENTLPIDQITVYSLAGKRIFQKTATSQKVPMDFSGLAVGTYMVAIEVNGAIKVVQIIRK